MCEKKIVINYTSGPFGLMKGCSMLFPTGVAGSDKDACTAESILSMSKVGELGADILSVVRSRTASSCLRSAEERRLVKYSSAKTLTELDISPAEALCLYLVLHL